MIFIGAGPIWLAIIVLAVCLCKMSSISDEIVIEEEPLGENWDWPLI